MNLTTMRAYLYRHLGYGLNPESAVITRLDSYVNEAYREILGMKGFARLRRSLLTFSSVANSPFAVLPQAASRIITIQDRTNMRMLTEESIQDLRYTDPGLTATSSFPDRYVIINLASPVAVDPSTADALHIKSDSVSDTGTAYLQGVITGGYPKSASVTMTGLTGVAIGGSDWIAVTKLFLSAAAVGNVTLTQTSDVGTELSRIQPGSAYARYSRIHLYPTPSTSATYYADVDLHVEDLAQAFDEPLLPEDFHWLLMCGAMMKEMDKREKPVSYGIHSSRWKRGLADLRVYLRQPTGVSPNSDRRPRRWSMLGPYFPSGS